MSDEEAPVSEQPADDDNIATEAMEQALDDGKGNKMVPLSALINAKREGKAFAKRVKELEPVAAQAQETKARVDAIQPFVDALSNSPRLRAEALRAVNGTRPSSDAPAQDEVDPDVVAFADEMGMYLADGTTLDTNRAQRVIARWDARSKRTSEDAIRPFAGLALNQKAEQNMSAVLRQVDEDGTPLASEESIREVASQLPAHLLANPQVCELILNNAIGIDRRKGRTPKATEEPLYLNTAGGRGNRQPAVDNDMKEFFKRHGIKEEDGAASIKRLEEGVSSRKGIALGVK